MIRSPKESTYSCCLSSFSVDDAFLQKAASAIPKHSIFLIEDIDCAFPLPREDADARYPSVNYFTGYVIPEIYPPSAMNSIVLHRKGDVTLSGLLNVLDGVGSEEGKLFFCNGMSFVS